MATRVLFEDLLDDMQARKTDARRLVVDEPEVDPYDFFTDCEEDLDPKEWQVVVEFKMERHGFSLYWKHVRYVFWKMSQNLLQILDNNRYVESHSKILWSSTVQDAHFANYTSLGFKVDEHHAYLSVGINFKPGMRYKACLKTIVALYNAFLFAQKDPEKSNTFIGVETSVGFFTGTTHLMYVPQLKDKYEDEFFRILKEGHSDNESNFAYDKIYKCVDYLCGNLRLGIDKFGEAVDSIQTIK